MSRHRPRRFGTMFALLLLLAGAAAGFWLYERHARFADAPLQGIEAGRALVVEPGDNLPVILRKLRAAGIDTGPELEWKALAARLGAAGKIQVGEYALAPGLTPRELLVAMRDGKVVQRRFTIVEGWNIRDLRAALRRAEPLKQHTAGMNDAELMSALGHPGQHPEGRFLPETYSYVTGDSDLDVLRRAHAAMAKALEAAWADRSPDHVLDTPEQLLILASIVEKETGVPEERPQIAGLFVRRLQLGMRLETDPTVIYGLGEAFDGDIRKRDLRADTPYNTYTRNGLPPTPIAMPGADALKASARPAPGEALFFVAVGDGSGRHLFARTYAEHQANVRAYLRNYRAAQSRASAPERSSR